MSADEPPIGSEQPAHSEGRLLMTHFLTVRDVRDPDGYLIEVGQATGLVERLRAEQAPAGSETGRADGR